MYCFGDPAKMSDEKVRLALRVHDEVKIVPNLSQDPEIAVEYSSDCNPSVTAVTCSALTFALVARISSTVLRKQ